MARRGKGGGSVYKHASGRWCAELSWIDPVTGKRRRVSRYADTRKEAEAVLAELVTAKHRGTLSDPNKVTVREWLEGWLSRRAREVRPRTAAIYRQELSYAAPSLGDPEAADPFGKMPLQRVKPAHVRALLDSLSGSYSTRTVRMVRQRLWQAFREALDMELVFRNPVDPVRIRTPRGEGIGKVGRALEPHEVRVLLEALNAHPDPRTALALRLMLACGLRLGECLGLQWQDLDLEAGTLTVRRAWCVDRLTQPKTRSSARTVPIPFATLERVKAYRQTYLNKGMRPDDLEGLWVFPGNNPSKPLDYNAPGHALKRIIDAINAKRQKEAEKTGVEPVLFPHTRIHDLRHSFGSHLLANGAPVELVAERMGHSTPNLTMSVYRHLLERERQGFILDPEDLIRQGPKATA